MFRELIRHRSIFSSFKNDIDNDIEIILDYFSLIYYLQFVDIKEKREDCLEIEPGSWVSELWLLNYIRLIVLMYITIAITQVFLKS